MIWCVEDDASIRDIEVYALQSTGFEAEGFADGAEFWEAVQKERPELVVLDVMLPGIDGIELLRRMKARAELREIPVVMATAKGAEYDKIQGLDLGADYYLVKPFGVMELVSCVKAVLRRTGVLAAEAPAAPAAGIAFNGWTLDTTRCELSDPQRNTVPLTQGEYGLLLALTQNARRVLSREQLLELTHSESAEVFDRTIDVLIMRLRRKIEVNPHQPLLIKTIRGLGYVFATDVSHHEKAA